MTEERQALVGASILTALVGVLAVVGKAVWMWLS